MLRNSPHIDAGTVLYIEQRPNAPFRYDAWIRTAYEKLLQLADGQVPIDLPGAFITDPALRHTIATGLDRGHFRDTTHVEEWLAAVNRDFEQLDNNEIPPLHLKVVHAETDIDLLKRVMIDEGHRPAGVYLSGSPKMIPKTIHTDPAVMQTAEVCEYLLEHNIPMLGICFGLQLLGYVKWGAMVDSLINPPRMRLRVLQEKPKRIVHPITPGAQQRNFGVYPIELRNSDHPILRDVSQPYGLKSHSTYFPFPHPVIPADAVLATSARRFLPDHHAPTDEELTDRVIEVLQYGAVAFGTQLHPEFTPDLLLALTHLPVVEQELKTEGLHVEFIREQLRPLSADDSTLQRFGYNFTKYYLVPQYLERLLRHSQRRETTRKSTTM